MSKKGNENRDGNRRPFWMTDSKMLFVRILVGAYLLYIVSSLKDTLKNVEANSWILFLAIAFVFGIIGIVLIGHSGKCLMSGEYIGGSKDPCTEKAEVKDSMEAKIEKIQRSSRT